MSEHKYWRLKNIATRDKDPQGQSAIIIAEIYFYDVNKSDISVGGTALCSGGYGDDRGNPANAFDKNIGTNWLNNFTSSGVTPSNTWIGYQFSVAQQVTQVGLRMRQDMQSMLGQEWQTADVECSDDGRTWVLYGRIEPKITQMDLSLKVADIILYSKVTGKSLQNNGKTSRFVLIHNWQTGDFIQKIVPLPDGSWVYNQLGNAPVLVTHVGDDGFKPRSDGGIVPVAVA